MISTINQVRKLALEMRKITSVNDDRYEKMQDIIKLCDEYRDHFIDDGR